jgi:RNA polymerase sigma factor (sigma-70 family)
VQESALKAWRGVGRLRPETDALRPWFLTIVANQCRSMRRSRWWGVVRVPEPRRAGSSTPISDDHLDLRRALSNLSDRDREVLALRYFLDLPVEEVARVLGITVAAAKSRLHRAIRTLEPALR